MDYLNKIDLCLATWQLLSLTEYGISIIIHIPPLRHPVDFNLYSYVHVLSRMIYCFVHLGFILVAEAVQLLQLLSVQAPVMKLPSQLLSTQKAGQTRGQSLCSFLIGFKLS